MSTYLPLGKLPASLLTELIAELPTAAPEVVVPPGIGCDAAGLRIGQRQVAVSTDPITFATHNLGTYSVCINSNDVACQGCRPRWYSATLLLPPDTTEIKVRQIWSDLGEALRKYDMVAIGGHTEVTATVKAPVLVGQVIGEAISDRLLNPADARPGNQILLWQGAAIEGTALLALEREQVLKHAFSEQELAKMQQLIHEPGLCVWPLVEQLLPDEDVIALHDPTEGGIATALHELADAAQCGVRITADSLPVLPETAKLAELLSIDPLGLLASGALLIVCRPNAVTRIQAKLAHEPIAHIGELTASPARVMESAQEGEKLLPRFDKDEVTRVLDDFE